LTTEAGPRGGKRKGDKGKVTEKKGPGEKMRRRKQPAKNFLWNLRGWTGMGKTGKEGVAQDASKEKKGKVVKTRGKGLVDRTVKCG